MKPSQRVYLPQAIMKISPCRGCMDRQVGCHGQCEAYKAWRQKADDVKEALVRESTNDAALNTFALEGRNKAMRRNSKTHAKPTKRV